MAMLDVSETSQEGFINYAITPTDAIGIERVRMRSDDKTITHNSIGINYTHLAHRWNLPEAQANVWLLGSLGEVQSTAFSGTQTLFTPGFQVDYETTRVYAATTAKFYRASDVSHNSVSVRAGFSFYEAQYDEVQPWFILEAKRVSSLSNKTSIMPMLRFIHKRYFVEVGVSTAREARMNFMFVY